MSNYVADYRRLDDNATRAESQAEEYRQRADHDRWEQCRIAHEAVESGEYSGASFADAVSKGATTIRYQVRMWERWRHARAAQRPGYWDAMAEIKGSSTGAERTTQMAISGARNLPATDKAKLAAELLDDDEVEVAPSVIARQASRPDVARAIARNDAAREAVEDQGIEVRAMRRPELPADIATSEARRESAERFRQDAGRAFGHETDEATNYLNGAASDLGHAIFAKEHWGIRFPEAEAEALEKIDRYLAAYRAGSTNKLSDDDRGWLERIGVEL